MNLLRKYLRSKCGKGGKCGLRCPQIGNDISFGPQPKTLRFIFLGNFLFVLYLASVFTTFKRNFPVVFV